MANISDWTKYNFEAEIRKILEKKYHKPDPKHHLGRPFMTAYQIAIELNNNNPNIAQALGVKISGKGIDEKHSLAQYIANQLLTRIKSGQITDIEGAFITLDDIDKLEFDNNIEPSNDNDISIFRLVEK
jgi:hypothetical protein